MLLNPKQKNVSPKERAVWSNIFSLGLVFPISITLGFFIGKWVGTYFKHPKIGIMIGLLWGMSTGFFELYKIATKLNKIDKNNTHDN